MQDQAAIDRDSRASKPVSSADRHSSHGDDADLGAPVDPNRPRTDTWRLLARLLRESPDAELVDRLAAIQTFPAGGRESSLARAWRELAEAAESADIARLDDEFHDLFIGLGRGELLPYASWYLTGFLMDKPLVALRRDLARLGIARTDKGGETEDHAAGICEAMALLSDPDEGVDQAGQQAFFQAHAEPWMGRFFTDLQNAKKADFFRAVGRLSEGFIEFERKWFTLPD